MLKGRGVSPGRAQGKALVTKQPFMYAHGIEVATGIIVDEKHELHGESIAGRIFIFPYNKGSTTGSTWFLENLRLGNGPLAIVNLETEPIIAAGSIMAKIFFGIEIPIVDRLDGNPTNIIGTGDHIVVNGNTGTVEITRKLKQMFSSEAISQGGAARAKRSSQE